MIQVRLVIKTSLLLVILVNAEAQQQQQQQQQTERQQRLRQPETFANKVELTTGKKWKFGDKKPTAVTAVPLPTKSTNFHFEDGSTATHLPVSVEYHDKSNRPTSKPFTQFDVPMVQKTRYQNAPSSNDSKKKGQRQRERKPANVMSSSSTASEKPNYAAKSQQQYEKRVAAIATPRNWSRGNRSEELNATNMKVNSVGSVGSVGAVTRNQRRQYVSNAAQRSSGLLTARPHSKKSAITTTVTKATTKITTTPTTIITTTTPRPTFLQSNPFNIFSPEFWGFSNPPTTTRWTTRKPPKKYTPTPSINSSSSEEKMQFQKAKFLAKAKTTPPITTPTTVAPTTKKDTVADAPFRIALPTFNFFNSEAQKKPDTENEKDKRAIVATLRERYNCPRESEVRFQLFPKICKIDEDCSVWNREELCCEIFGAKSCVSGLPKPLEESSHAPILGLIQRKCPSRPLAELWWEVKECETDMDCWPRVCCPDGRRRYCRTSQPELETAPVPVKRSFDYLTEYLECTPPPPPIFDLHPKACTSTFDCFPNVCCQEAGLRHCRPPKKSVLTLMANFLNVDVVKRFAQNIVIK